MAEEKMSMPSGMGGLVRYFDEYQSRIKLKPEHVVMMIAVFIIFEVLVRL